MTIGQQSPISIFLILILSIFLRILAYIIGYPLFHLVLKIKVEGRENLPPKGEPLIIVCNHFSWFEAPLLYGKLPYDIIYLGSAEVWEHPIGKLLAKAFKAIPIHRGRPEREALKQSLQVLKDGGVLGIFPEAGIDPELRDLTDAGHSIADIQGQRSRIPPRLIPARPGAAYFAIRSDAKILPTAVLNGEYILSNLRKLKRTPVTLIIGQPFGPLTLDKTIKGSAKRDAIDALGDKMMYHIAELLPPEQRGPYS